jgi:catechol 2,3-dioxygenase-like lactoylglutathione lyase family enzyme
MIVEWLNHTGLVVSDMERSMAFYRDVLGLTEERNEVLEGEMISLVTGFENTKLHVAYLGNGDMRHSVELVQYLNPVAKDAPRIPSNAVGTAHLGAIVKDLDAVFGDLSAMGLEFVGPPAVRPDALYPWARKACFLTDPDGYLIELIERAPTPPGEKAV